MGQDIESSEFSSADFTAFEKRLAQETQLLGEWFTEGRFSDHGKVGGFELEAWLLEPNNQPCPCNDQYLKLAVAEGLPVVHELARFNIEINSQPRNMTGNALSLMHEELSATWHSCDELAQQMDKRVLMTGILPTVQDTQLSLANMSSVERYRALNEQVLRLRQGRPLDIHIKGRETLKMQHNDVMFESAATSFQLHFQVELDKAARFYNAAHIVSGPIVAAAANSPFLFGHDLWDETRIPLFEQAVALGGQGHPGGKTSRVTFGAAYVESSVFECFQRNEKNYPVLLPALTDDPLEAMTHLRLHNGTIWRWNRPLIGFDAAGEPHLRLEHRVAPAGPTVIDAVANAALFFGLTTALADMDVAAETRLDFEAARTNFYAAAQHGLAAKIHWLDGREWLMSDLLEQELLPMARQGLNDLGIDQADRTRYMDVIDARVRTRANGANWQRRYVERFGHDMAALTQAYLDNQSGGAPVHEWPL